MQGGNRKSVALADVLKELEEMPAPEGVDSNIFTQLKSALAEALNTHSQSRRGPAEGRVNFSPAGRAGLKPSVLVEEPARTGREGERPSPTSSALRFVSKPPTGEKNRVEDLVLMDNLDGTFSLTWTYKNVGDYNQDGIVSIQDISPLAEHFMEIARLENEWMDGDGNGVINIGDVTPLAENFFSQVAGYLIRGGNSQDGPLTEMSRVAFVQPESERLKVFAELVSETKYTVFYVVPYDSDGWLGEPSNAAVREPPPSENLFPVAILNAEPTVGVAPLTVLFDASGSYDPDGEIVKYEWDWEGDGVYDSASSSDPTTQFTFELVGVYNPKLRVTDDREATSEVSATVTVEKPTPNEPPVANLKSDVSYGSAPLTVTLDASESYDPDGIIVKYEWDWEGDGIWEYDSGAQPIVLHTYTEPYVPDTDHQTAMNSERSVRDLVGGYRTTVRVTDNIGESAAATVVIGVAPKPPPVSDQGDWYMFGRDARHTRKSPFVGPRTNNLAWSVVIEDGDGDGDIRLSSPVCDAEGGIYIGSESYGLVKIDGATRSVVWTHTANGAVRGTPAVGRQGAVVFGTWDGVVVSLAPNGEFLWLVDPEGNDRFLSSASSLLGGGGHYIGGLSGMVHSISVDPISGSASLRWSYETGGPVRSSPAVNEDVFVGSDDGYLYRITKDGDLRWRYRTGGRITSSPYLNSGSDVFVGSEDGYFYALYSNGELWWRTLYRCDDLQQSGGGRIRDNLRGQCGRLSLRTEG